MDENLLYYGDNLDILRRYIEDESVDLIYLDPPFNSNQNYNVLFGESNGSQSNAQIKAFEDTWHWSQDVEEAYHELITTDGQVSVVMQAFRKFLGENDMMAYLSMMAPRLLEMKRVLKTTGSIYLHCDPTASHYLKILMDSIFGPTNFKNEIIWRRTGAHAPQKKFGPIHDTILFYTKSSDFYFHIERLPYMRGHVESRYKLDDQGKLKFTSGGNILTGSGKTNGESGMPWRDFDPSSKNRHWAIPGYLTEQMPPEFKEFSVLKKLEVLYEAGLIEIDKEKAWPVPVRYLRPGDGQPISDIWAHHPYTKGTVYGTDDGIDGDVSWLGTTDPERTGYQTQKPVGLLERIIRCSCPEDGIVLDPFCGCGTAIIAAQKLNRKWIGVDITHLAMTLIKMRLSDAFEGVDYTTVGEPVDLTSAQALAEQDPYQFQWWALGLIGARPEEEKKGADKGIDGRIIFFERPEDKAPKQIVISVKSGKVAPTHIRDLIGVVQREKAACGIFITFQLPSSNMIKEASSAGFYSPAGLSGDRYPKIQILTIEDLLNGKKILSPVYMKERDGNVTFRRVPKERKIKGKEKKITTLDRFT